MNIAAKKTLNLLQKSRHKFWNISPETGEFLSILIKTQNIKTVLEIGTSNGYSAIHMAEALTRTKGRLYTVESKKARLDLAIKNFKKAKLTSKITTLFGHAPECIPINLPPFDLIFLDATKCEYPNYFKYLQPLTKKSTIIVADNAISHKQALIPYYKILKNSTYHTTLLPLGSGLLVSLKK